jgi:hypothetical protein
MILLFHTRYDLFYFKVALPRASECRVIYSYVGGHILENLFHANRQYSVHSVLGLCHEPIITV